MSQRENFIGQVIVVLDPSDLSFISIAKQFGGFTSFFATSKLKDNLASLMLFSSLYKSGIAQVHQHMM